ncbi:MAG: hypothetical protein J5809_04055 [Selenomonadaceae bacterium]|nr:hypothetical protein [Selenomonadaceae bacterium]
MVKNLLTAFLCALVIAVGAKVSAAEMEMVSYSAQVKLQWLASAGVPEAKRILKELGQVNIYSEKNLRDYDRIEKVNSIYQELVYAAAVQYVQQNDYRNILDIGGGYTPRAMVFAREGRKYFGGELMAVAVSADEVMKKILEPKYMKNIVYDEVLAEDNDAFLSAADTFDGKICIVEQGLMIYLTQDRLADMYENIADVLRQNGGCFITSDLMTRELFKDIAAALYGEDQAQILYDETKDMYEELFYGFLNEENFNDRLDAIQYARDELNLKIHHAPLILDTSKLYCTRQLTAEQAEKIKQIAAKKYLWVITAD